MITVPLFTESILAKTEACGVKLVAPLVIVPLTLPSRKLPLKRLRVLHPGALKVFPEISSYRVVINPINSKNNFQKLSSGSVR
jgi:hypothetical protein